LGNLEEIIMPKYNKSKLFVYEIYKKKMIKLKKSGLTYGKIGLKFGLSRQRVHQIITGYRDNDFMREYMRRLRANKKKSNQSLKEI